MTRKSFIISFLLLAIILVLVELIFRGLKKDNNKNQTLPLAVKDSVWIAPDTSQIPHSAEGDIIRYGRMLISNTSDFFGQMEKLLTMQME